jgi:hypothetical protein
MNPLPFVAVVVASVIWSWFVYKRRGRRTASPQAMAFTTTTIAVLFIVAGSAGYMLDKRARFFADSAWSDDVIWWEIGVGFAFVPLALYFWRRGLRDIDRRLSP